MAPRLSYRDAAIEPPRVTITEADKEEFLSLPQEQHERLHKATAEAMRRTAVVDKTLRGEELTRALSTAENFDLARRLVDLHPKGKPADSLTYYYYSVSSGELESEEFHDGYAKFLTSFIPRREAGEKDLLDIEDSVASLTPIAIDSVRSFLKEKEFPVNPMPVAIVQCGSHVSGAALSDSPVDLLVKTVEDNPPFVVKELPLVLVYGFLAKGYLAALAPSPHDKFGIVVKVCEKRDEALLEELRRQYVSKETRLTDSKFKPSHGTEFRFYFSADNSMFVPSDLMACYDAADPRLPELLCVVKRWAKYRDIYGAENGFLSGYGFQLMALHFLLHADKEPAIENLQSTSFGRRHDEIRAKATAENFMRNPQTTDALLRRFFAFYSASRLSERYHPILPFNWANEVITIGEKRRVLKAEKGWKGAFFDKVQHWAFLAIEDPCDPGHNVAEFVAPVRVTVMREEFARAHNILDSMKFLPTEGFEWRDRQGHLGEDLFTPRKLSCAEIHILNGPRENLRNELCQTRDEIQL